MANGIAEKIVDAASELFAEYGVRGASLGDIAKQVGISKGTLSYYFPAKQQIIEAVTDRTLRSIGDRIFAWVDTVKRDDDPTAALDILCEELLGDNSLLRVFIAVNGAAESDELVAKLDRAMGEWNVMLEVGILRMQPAVADRMRRMIAAILPFMCGLASLNADPEYAKHAFTALVLG